MEELHSQIVPIPSLTPNSIKAMFDLYANYYQQTSIGLFEKDLFKKNSVLQIFNESNELIGFTTILNYVTLYQSQKLHIVFSGDTIMADRYWGRPILAFSWLKYAGILKAKKPELPLYWFIIVKGHRTYRYLPVFSKVFYPNFQNPTPLWEQNLIHHLAKETFADNYDESRGIIHFAKSQGHLKEPWAAIPTKLLNRKDIQFFKSKNPDYDKGDELVCLCRLDDDNLKPMAQRLFDEGLAIHA